jgi:hypothetical protein
VSDYDEWKTTEPIYWDDEPDDDYDAERDEPRPDFGCACEEALIVDTVCEGCIEWMKEQDRPPKETDTP